MPFPLIGSNPALLYELALWRAGAGDGLLEITDEDDVAGCIAALEGELLMVHHFVWEPDDTPFGALQRGSTKAPVCCALLRFLPSPWGIMWA